jgi:hypothetical protein
MYTQKMYNFIFWLVGDSSRYGRYDPFYGQKSAFGKWKKYLEIIIISSEANNCYANIIDNEMLSYYQPKRPLPGRKNDRR